MEHSIQAVGKMLEGFTHLHTILLLTLLLLLFSFHQWLLQDVIAGVTVGMVMVPQGIAYAKIANLEPQYGL